MFERTYELELMSDLFNLFVRKICELCKLCSCWSKGQPVRVKDSLRAATEIYGRLGHHSLFPMLEIECQVQIVCAFIWNKIS